MFGKSTFSIGNSWKIFDAFFLLFIFAYCLTVCLYRVGHIFFLECDEYIRAVHIGIYYSRIFNCGQYSLPTVYDYSKCSDFFIMMSAYRGAFIQYFPIPFIWLFYSVFGFWFSVKIAMAVLFFVTLWCFWFVIKNVAGNLVALLCVVFVIVNPANFMSFRFALALETGFQVAGLWLGLAFLVKFSNTKTPIWFYFAMFIFGLTLWTKIMFLGYGFGAFVGMAVLGKCQRRRLFRRILPVLQRERLIGVFAFILGCSPLLYFNIVNRFETVIFLFGAFVDSGNVDGWNNFDVISNLMTRMNDIYLYLSGTLVERESNLKPVIFPVVLFVVSIIWSGVYVSLLKIRDGVRYLILFIVPAYFTLIVLTCFLPAHHDVFHILIMTPFIELLCALFVVVCCRRLTNKNIVLGVVCCVMSFWSFGYGEKTIGILRDVNLGLFSQCYYLEDIDSLAADLHDGADNVFCSSSIGWVLHFLHPEVNVYVFDGALCFLPMNLDELKKNMPHDRNYLLLVANEDNEIILEICRQYQLRPRLEKVFDFAKDNERKRILKYHLDSQ